MEQPTSLSKEELLECRTEIQALMNAAEETLVDDTQHARINTPFVVTLVALALLYPVFTTAFNIWYYIFLWVASLLLIFIGVKLFLKILGSVTQFSTYKILETAINNDLETIRKTEYDNITGKNIVKKDVNNVYESTGTAIGNREDSRGTTGQDEDDSQRTGSY